MAEELTNGKFEDFIKEGLVLVDFFADWCMPCVMMGPIIDDISEKFKGKVNVGDNVELAQRYDISSVPNFLIFKVALKFSF